jgi:hypothetical protein
MNGRSRHLSTFARELRMSGTIRKNLPLLLAVSVILFSHPDPARARDSLEGVDFGLSAGYRVDQLDWNIAGNLGGTSPNILSELSWDDLESYQVTAGGRLVKASHSLPLGGLVRGSFSYGSIFSGSNQDSDYSGDNRTREFSRSNNGADEGNVWDLSLGGGVAFFLADRKLSLSPVLGFSYHQQNLRIRDGYQTLSDPNNLQPLPPGVKLPPVGPIAGLDSTYDTEWRSGWLGLDLDYLPLPNLRLHGTAEFHAGNYEATGDWNLRNDLQHPESFKHTSDNAYGLVTNLELRTGGERLQVSLDVAYQKWRAEDGLDWIYMSDGTVGVTRLNEVNWEATSIDAGLTVLF